RDASPPDQSARDEPLAPERDPFLDEPEAAPDGIDDPIDMFAAQAAEAEVSDAPARRSVRAPVLLRDISITRRPGRDDFDLRADRNLEISPVLLHYLRSRFRIEIDEDLIADLNDIVDDPERISEVLDKLGGLLVDAPDFRIMPGVLIGTFHYAKLAMHQDLVDNADAFPTTDLF